LQVNLVYKLCKLRYDLPMRSTHAPRKTVGDMRRFILREAFELFAKEGVSGVTMRAIAKRIGYSPAAIYRYFPKKLDIFHALKAQGFAKFNAAMAPHYAIGDVHEKLIAGARGYIRFAMENPVDYELMFHLAGAVRPEGDPDDDSPPRKAFNLLLGLIGECMEAGVAPRGDPLPAALSLWSTLHGFASLLVRGKLAPLCPEGEVDQMVDAVVAFTMRNV